jgi:hypothetical protein
VSKVILHIDWDGEIGDEDNFLNCSERGSCLLYMLFCRCDLRTDTHLPAYPPTVAPSPQATNLLNSRPEGLNIGLF